MKVKNKVFVLVNFVITLIISQQMNYITLQINSINLVILKLLLTTIISLIIMGLLMISIINIQEILIVKKSVILNVILWCLNYINLSFLITINYFIYLSTNLPIIGFKSVVIIVVIGYVLLVVNIFKKKNQLQKLFNEMYLLILILILSNYLLMSIILL